MISKSMLEAKWLAYCEKRGWNVVRDDDLIALKHNMTDGYVVRAVQDMGIDGQLIWGFYVERTEDLEPIRPYPLGLR